MEERAKINDIVAIGFFGLVISMFLFGLLEVIGAQILQDFVIDKFESKNNSILLFILLGGYLLGLLVGMIGGLFASEDIILKRDILKASITSFIVNIIFWSIFTLLILKFSYDININWSDIFVLFPRILIYFALYIIDSISLFFILCQVSYFIFFVIFLILYKAKRK